MTAPQLPPADDESLGLLKAAWAEARAGSGRVVHLVGTTGRGRTTLLARFLEAVGGPGERAAAVSARFGDARLMTSGQGLMEDLIIRVAEGVRAIEATGEEAAERPPRPEVPRVEARGAVPWLLPGADFLASARGLSLAFDGPEAAGRTEAARLLLDITRHHPVIVALDDVHRADPASRRLVAAVTQGLAADDAHHLLVVLTSAHPLADEGAAGPLWTPDPAAVVYLPPVPHHRLKVALEARLSPLGTPDEAWLDEVLELAQGNPRVAEALISASERAGALKRDDEGRIADPLLSQRPEVPGLTALIDGRLPTIPAHVRADLQVAAVVGGRFTVARLAELWDVPMEAARIRVEAMAATGLVFAVGAANDGVFVFVSDEVVAHLIDGLAPESRLTLNARLGARLREEVKPSTTGPTLRPGLDVTETWMETRRRARQLHEAFDRLWAATRHFELADQPARAAEAAVTLGERLFETSGGYSYLAGRHGRREDRERRHRIYVALSEAAVQLARAKARGAGQRDAELLAIEARLLVVQARFKEVLGDFARARSLADMAVDLAGHLDHTALWLEALRVRLEVCYAAGDHSAARPYLAELMQILAHTDNAEAEKVLSWVAEAIGQWEWIGLQARLFPGLLRRLEALDSPRPALKARIERLAASVETEHGLDHHEAQLNELLEVAREQQAMDSTAELLAAYAAEMIQAVVDAHYDTLSGEFFPPDLYGEGHGPQIPPLAERLAWPLRVLERAEDLARDESEREGGARVTLLRVLTTRLGLSYDVRERLSELMERWGPLNAAQPRPPRLDEVMHLLAEGPFGVDALERLTERAVALAHQLDLHQVLADTLYEALDRELPGAIRQSSTLFVMAREAYQRVGDTYGLVTLTLVEHRLEARRNRPADQLLDDAIERFEAGVEALNPEQSAFVQLRFGELLLEAKRAEEAQVHLERSIALYEELGDMERVQTVGEILSGVYRAAGDLGRYRGLRARFLALEERLPGVDPLGLEMRIEHLLNRARNEANEEKAIEMVERCVRLFARIPDGTTRIDECYVEISKICRRRADEAQTEGAFHGWLRRSLSAVEAATAINRSLGNHHRLFEEYHELFDDLMGLGEFEAYLRARAESRELAFQVGHIGELMYLFEEHLQHDPEVGFDKARMPEARGFYEALIRTLLGLGATEEAARLKLAFVDFLRMIGFEALADLYNAQPPRIE